jgi:hypothetical protein
MGEVIRISETKVAVKKIRIQINGKFNDINNADENE